MCKADEETTHHLFQNCHVATEIRDYVYTTFGAQYSIPPKYHTHTSNDLLTDSIETMAARQLELVICFILWRERCRHIFSGKSQRYMSLVREIQLEHTAWFGEERINTASALAE